MQEKQILQKQPAVYDQLVKTASLFGAASYPRRNIAALRANRYNRSVVHNARGKHLSACTRVPYLSPDDFYRLEWERLLVIVPALVTLVCVQPDKRALSWQKQNQVNKRYAHKNEKLKNHRITSQSKQIVDSLA